MRNDLGGTVHGPSVQVGAVHGDIRLLGAPSGSTSPPRQLPPVSRVANRESELRALDRFRERAIRGEGPTAVTISGLGGVGKTALALHWLHGIRSTVPDGQLFAGLGAQSPDGPAHPGTVLGMFLRALGVPAEGVPAETEERLGLYRSLTAGRRLAVLLDDAVSAAQVRPLLPSGTCLAVVTSRWRLPGLSVDGCLSMGLDPLGADAAVELLASTLGDGRVRDEPAEARALAGLCAGLPLAVRVVGARLAARPGRPLRAMVRALSDEHSRLDAMTIEDDHSVRAALDLSHRALTGPAARLYRLLALHPGADFGVNAARALSAGPPGEAPAGDILDLLDQLLDANLLFGTGEERYRLHDLVRLHARGLLETEHEPEDRERALRRLLDHYLASATAAECVLDPHHRSLPRTYGPGQPVAEDFHGDPRAALDWLEREHGNLMAAIGLARKADVPAVAWQLADAMWPLFTRRKHYESWRAAHREGLAAARTCGDRAAQCRMLTSGGLGELDTGGHARALEMFNEAARLFRESGDALGHARTLNYRGLACLGLGRLDEAAGFFRRAAEECPRHGDRRAGGLASLNLADTSLRRGDSEPAVTHASRAHEVLAEEGDPYNAARAGILLGRALTGLGRAEEAGERLRRAVAALRESQAGYELARALEALGELAEHLGQNGTARSRYAEALEHYDRLAVPAAGALRARLGRLGGPPSGP
ncbi:tetratricopeptide repeat protein [Streptomyces albus]|uniref:ATP-binding protein n=1 Tax=Streptomyces albus TaxID=1888 RepID=UPI001FCA1A5D|nr:tetratricopeptide repeat protein [Streptomyces albus]